jgi:hypothetical protein
MRTLYLLIMVAALLSGCDAWNVAPQPFPVWTPIPTRTPGVVTATPNIIFPTWTASPTGTALPLTLTFTPETPTFTSTPTLIPITDTVVSPTRTPFTAVQIDILGCNTGLDVSHGMGEVTNAYVILKNTGTVDLPNACAMLRAADEDREHPDKTRCVDMLPAGYQVTFKLTVDSTYKVDTVIQVDASSNSNLLLRVDRPSCTDIDLSAGGVPPDVGVVKPITP